MKACVSYGIMGLLMLSLLLACSPSNTTPGDGSAGGKKTVFTKHFQNSLFKITEHAVFSVEILLDDKEYTIGKNVVGIAIHDAHDQDVCGAQITFVLKDLVAGKNALATPTLKEKGNGIYAVSGLDLKKEGKWELGIMVKKDRIEDLVTFVLPDALKSRKAKGNYSP